MSIKITYWVIVILLLLNILFAGYGLGLVSENRVTFGTEVRNNSENDPPVLSEPKMTPISGDTNTEFLFTVHYYDPDSDEPDFIIIMIDNIFYNMNLRSGQLPYNGIYEYKTYLFEGEHTYYFITSNKNQSVKTENFSTNFIKKPEKKAQDQSWEEWTYIIIIILLIAPIIIIYFTLRVTNRRREVSPEDKSSEGVMDESRHISPGLAKSRDTKKQRRRVDITSEPGFVYRCYKCDTVVTPDLERCPTCGEELSF